MNRNRNLSPTPNADEAKNTVLTPKTTHTNQANMRCVCKIRKILPFPKIGNTLFPKARFLFRIAFRSRFFRAAFARFAILLPLKDLRGKARANPKNTDCPQTTTATDKANRRKTWELWATPANKTAPRRAKNPQIRMLPFPNRLFRKATAKTKYVTTHRNLSFCYHSPVFI